MNIPRFNAEEAEKYRAEKMQENATSQAFLSVSFPQRVLCAKTFSQAKKTFIPCNLLHDFFVDYRMKF